MHTTSRSRLLILVATAALAVGGLAACGGDDGGGSAASFCSNAERLEEAFGDFDEQNISDPSEMVDVFDDLKSQLDSIDPPSEISGDWATLTGALDAVSEVFAEIDFEDPEALASLSEQMSDVEEQFGDIEGATERIGEYARDECGVDLDD